MQDIILSPIRLEDLIAQLRIVIKEEVQQELRNHEQERLLSVKEVCSFLKITRQTLSNYSNKGVLVPHHLEGRIYYRYSHIIQSLEKVKRYQR